MVFDYYDRVRIVSLPDRTDRRREMRGELRDVGADCNPRVGFFDAFKLADPGPFLKCGSHGCYRSHLTILRQAAAARESVLILQDDCEFLPGIAEYVVPEDTDILYGGYHASDPSNLHESHIIGAHFMGFSARAARLASEYLTQLLDPSFPADPKAAAQSDFDPAVRPPIDGAMVWFRRAHPELRTVFHLLANQRASRSDVTPHHLFDRLVGLRRLASAARNLKRLLHNEAR